MTSNLPLAQGASTGLLPHLLLARKKFSDLVGRTLRILGAITPEREPAHHQVLCYCDPTQLIDAHGKDKAEVSNLNNLFFGKINSVETIMRVSDTFGLEVDIIAGPAE